MDPLSIIGVAAAAVQFLDFGTRLLAETIGVYQGASAANARLLDIAKVSGELAAFTRQVREKMSPLARPNHALTISEIALLDACQACESASQGVMEFISKISSRVVTLEEKGNKKNKHSDPSSQNTSKLESLRMAVKLVSKKSQICDMEMTLRDIKSRLMLAMISNLWERSGGQRDHPADDSQAASRHCRLIEQLNPRPINTGDAASMQALLSNLRFPSQDNRVQTIPKAYERTFDWIFQEPCQLKEDAPMWSSFPNWLEHDAENVFWITGKPGSGKSTMMKYLAQETRTTSYLNKWSSPWPALVVAFYSWNAGTELQKSQGLLRTLLYQVIEKAPNLGPKLLPGRWAAIKIFGETAADQLPSWTWQELFESLTLLSSLNDRPFNLAVFVDGLDEFDGDHVRLIDVIKLFHSRPGIKVCVSSRPWNDFRDAFADCPQVRMEMLTKQDMESFVRGKFEMNRAFTELQAVLPTDAQELLLGIVEKAKGVFLWVSVVTS
ncbi:hypothetical protein MFIFM68171_06060 [Madurella fahalii]|uniref:Nephrocystin 3-like N-terminal domain-containing protein n=1 Tax=Madurella fahalii TaxID=1157608 RepID=A0ABQ0GDU4_9PEZI